MFKPLNIRHDIDLAVKNVTLLTLGEAVRRWRADGQFLMTEVNHTDAFESKDVNIPLGSSSDSIGKIEATLAGIDFVKDVKASSNQPSPASSEPGSSESSPAASAE